MEKRKPRRAPAELPAITGRFIPELDGVRGVAVLLVLLCHSLFIQPIPDGVPNHLALASYLFLGWSGVDLFFVLSGFLITGILLDSLTAKNYFRSFYARRVLRIIPLYVIVVFAYFYIVAPLYHHNGLRPSSDGSLEPWFWFHLSNWKIAFGADPGWLVHFWSLAIEEQFYLFWPVVVFLAGRRWLPYVCIALIATSFGLRCLYSPNSVGVNFIYTLTPFRVEPLAFGALAALAVRDRRMLSILGNGRILTGVSACGLLVLATIVAKHSTGYGNPPMATYGYTAFAVVFSCLVLYAHVYSGSSAWLASLLRGPWLMSFGKYSYAIYVLHLPIYTYYSGPVSRISDGLREPLRSLFWLVALAGGVGLSYAGALVSWHLVEKHFWNLKRRFAIEH